MLTKATFPRCSLAVAVTSVGLAALVQGVYLETRNPRTNQEDAVAWAVLAAATFLIGTGASLPFVRWPRALALGVLSPFVAWVLLVAIFWISLVGTALFNATFR